MWLFPQRLQSEFERDLNRDWWTNSAPILITTTWHEHCNVVPAIHLECPTDWLTSLHLNWAEKPQQDDLMRNTRKFRVLWRKLESSNFDLSCLIIRPLGMKWVSGFCNAALNQSLLVRQIMKGRMCQLMETRFSSVQSGQSTTWNQVALVDALCSSRSYSRSSTFFTNTRNFRKSTWTTFRNGGNDAWIDYLP
jgi:hypothetical protein